MRRKKEERGRGRGGRAGENSGQQKGNRTRGATGIRSALYPKAQNRF